MTDSAPAPRKERTAQKAAQAPELSFRADLPLAILESVRQHDRPAEVLEDEDLPTSLPRRLGLTGVVDSQIHRYRSARAPVSAGEVADLLRLVLRRPDSEPILREAGYAIAREQARNPLSRIARLGRIAPPGLAARIASRLLSRLLRRIGGGVPVTVTRNPLQVEMDGPVTSRVDRLAVACVLYSAAIEEAVRHATRTTPHVHHTHCQARGEDRCRWTVT
jgi:predicted hydrocarbon binding protein